MASPQHCSPHGWTTDTLESHFNAAIAALRILGDEREDRNRERFLAAKSEIVMALAAADRALVKAESALEKRLDNMNEFRQMLLDQNAHFLTRDIYDVAHNNLIDQISTNTQRLTAIEVALKTHKEGISVTGSIIIGTFTVFAVVISFATFAFNLMRYIK